MLRPGDGQDHWGEALTDRRNVQSFSTHTGDAAAMHVGSELITAGQTVEAPQRCRALRRSAAA